MQFIVLLGRIFFSAIFVLSSLGHFTKHTIDYASQMGLPMASVLVPISGIIGLLGGLSILLGFKAKWGAWLIVIFLVPITLTMHKFWGVQDAMMASIQQAMFMKNLAMIGGALLISYFGSGPFSLKH